jgi:hypothetical protein
MKLSREELEDIWENKPYGYLSKLVKERKGTKKFIVTTEARRAVVVDQEVQEVWAKDHIAAQNKVHSTATNVLRRRLGFDMWDGSVSYTTRAKSC